MGKVISVLFVIVAIIMSILGSTIPLDRLHNFILVMRFFENMIPILAVGALLKYSLSDK